MRPAKGETLRRTVDPPEVTRGSTAAPDAAGVLVAASSFTIGCGSARVWRRRSLDPPPPPRGDLGADDEGLTDFRLRRTVTQTARLAPSITLLAKEVEARFPWLATDEGEEELPHHGAYAGTAHYFGAGDRWTEISRGDLSGGRGHTDPAWIIEVLALTDIADARENEPVRGEPCRRYGFAVDLACHPGRVEVPPHRGRRLPWIAGEARVDATGRIRRVTWQQVMPLRARARRRLGATTSWDTSEFWDFGVPTEISVPAVRHTPAAVVIPQAIWRLWRAKRAYERDQRND